MTYNSEAKMIQDDLRTAGALECRYCKGGWRHYVGNCVICGCGPAPGAVEFIPQNDAEKERALAGLLHQLRREPIYREISGMLNEWASGSDPPSALVNAIGKRFGN
jgi:hypothetical protein